MRFTRKHKDGDMRILKKFAWFPYELGYETRWLETIYVVQIYHILMDDWRDIGWAEPWEYEHFVKTGYVTS